MNVRQRCLHLRSDAIVDGLPKKPTPDILPYGEIAINYASDNEKLFIKNANDQIVSFTTEDSIMATEEVLTNLVATNKSDLDTIKKKLSFYEGINKVGSLANIAVSKRLVIAEVNANQSFSLASVPEAGKEIHIILTNNGKKNITISLPTTGNYKTLGANALTVKSQETKEINAISDGTKVYIRTA